MIWWASADPLSNDGLSTTGHLELFLNTIGTLGDRQVLWDEYYHGHSRSFASYVVGTPIAWAAVQLGAIACIALFTYARRRGPVRSSTSQPRSSPLEFIDTMGELYGRARAGRAAMGSAARRLRRMLTDRTGLPPTKSDEDLVNGLVARYGIDRDQLATPLARWRRAASQRVISERDVLSIVDDLQGASVRIQQVRQGRRPHAAGELGSR
jgi:hypothetical protein